MHFLIAKAAVPHCKYLRANERKCACKWKINQTFDCITSPTAQVSDTAVREPTLHARSWWRTGKAVLKCAFKSWADRESWKMLIVRKNKQPCKLSHTYITRQRTPNIEQEVSAIFPLCSEHANKERTPVYDLIYINHVPNRPHIESARILARHVTQKLTEKIVRTVRVS